MLHHVKRLAKKKSVVGLTAFVAVTGTILGTQAHTAKQPLHYVMAAVTRGPLMVTVTGSGQVSGQNQVDVKPNVSGAVTAIFVKTNDTVTEGTPLFRIDSKTASKAVRDAAQSVHDASLSLQSSQLSLQKLKKAADPVSLIQAQNTLNQAQRDLETLKAGPSATDVQQAQNDLAAQKESTQISYDGTTPKTIRNAYDNAVQTVKAISLTLQQSLADADAILGIDNTSANDSYERWLSILDTRPLNLADAEYPSVKTTVTNFKTQADALATSGENTANVDASLTQAQAALDAIVPLLQNVQDALNNTMTNASFSQSSLDALKNTMQSDRTAVAGKVSSLTSQTQAIDQAKTSYANALLNVQKSQDALDKLLAGATASELATAQERVDAAEAALVKVQQGADPLDIAIAENAVAQRQSSLVTAQNRLVDAQETLNDYTVRAPFDGVVGRVTTHVADQASPSTALGTMITQAKIAELALNEVDATKVKVGQKATLTFDAIPDLTIAGTVSEVDGVGTVSQGVVSYPVKIAFVTQDDRIKTGMSVSASIVTDIHTDTLMVPNAAIHIGPTGQVVLTLQGNFDKTAAVSAEGVASSATPQTQTVRTGLANDQMTEITEGLNEGDLVITRTIDPSTTKTSTSAGASGVRIPGITGGGGGGGGTRVIRTGG